MPHSAGDALEDRIGNDLRRRGELGIPDVDRITALLEQMVAAGTSRVRSHTDIDPEVGLRGVEAVRAAAERLGGRIGVEQVAFPQHGLLINPGTAELLEEALGSGVETIGGIDPAGIDGDPVRHLDILFDLAARYDAGIDLHLHDAGSLGVWELELIAERTRDAGLRGRVTVSHAYGFCQADAATQGRVIERLTEAGVTLVTAAVYSFPVPPIKRLRAAGANVACGHDGICDLWGPYGSGDMLERAMHVAYRSTFRRDEDIELALDAATYGGARALGLERYGLVPGAPADLVVVAARTAAEAVVRTRSASSSSRTASRWPATGASSEHRARSRGRLAGVEVRHALRGGPRLRGVRARGDAGLGPALAGEGGEAAALLGHLPGRDGLALGRLGSAGDVRRQGDDRLVPADADGARAELGPELVVDVGDVLEQEPRASAGLGREAQLDPRGRSAVLPCRRQAVGRLAPLDRPGRVALQLVPAARPQVAGDREEPPRQALGVGARVPEVLGRRPVDARDGERAGLAGRERAAADRAVDAADLMGGVDHRRFLSSGVARFRVGGVQPAGALGERQHRH